MRGKRDGDERKIDQETERAGERERESRRERITESETERLSRGCVSEVGESLSYHPAGVWLGCLQQLKLLYLALLHIPLQLPRTVLVGQGAPLHQVVHHLLQQRQGLGISPHKEPISALSFSYTDRQSLDMG